MAMQVISLTDAAADRVKALLAKRDKPAAGLRVSVDSKGCSGLAYVVDYVDEPTPGDDLVEDKGVKVFVDPKAVLYLLGSEMDYVEDKFSAGLVFKNPNEAGRCGCGESFHVADDTPGAATH
ncbi:MAG TPA: iron-sulfur cluster assembly accessory protein [Alphaproteobacteria bacterium]|nr:iron-sulfur cluster assembly accessory protein [Alphaproteobacteria bacterium]